MIGRKNKQSGYIALITMFVAVFMCTALVASVGWGVWFVQQSVTVRENSAQARELAQSCARLGVQRAVQDRTYTGPETFNLPGAVSCVVRSIRLSDGVYVVDTESVVNDSVSHLITTVSATTYEVVARSQSP